MRIVGRVRVTGGQRAPSGTICGLRGCFRGSRAEAEDAGGQNAITAHLKLRLTPPTRSFSPRRS